MVKRAREPNYCLGEREREREEPTYYRDGPALGVYWQPNRRDEGTWDARASSALYS